MPDALLGVIAVAVGAMIGAPARHFISQFMMRHAGDKFPWGTLTVNVSGCLAMGALASYAAAHGHSSHSTFWLLLATGLLGSFTTVSAFAFQALTMISEGKRRLAIRYAALSIGLCIGAVAAGFSFTNLFQ
jgi:CrcB protein